MLFSDVEVICDKLLSELKNGRPIKRIRVSPLFYHTLCSVIDEVPCDSLYGIDVVEDPAVETYEIQS